MCAAHDDPRPGDTAVPTNSQADGPLTGLRVVELTDAIGAYCGKLLADMGAEVIKVEPPEGDPTRRLPPFARDSDPASTSLFFQYMNTNKQSLVLDLTASDGQEMLHELATGADVLVESQLPGSIDEHGLGYETLRADNPGLVFASITHFGQTGPAARRPGSDLVISALGGAMGVTGHPDDPPVSLAGTPAYITASTCAASGILAALHHRRRTGLGQRVDISALEAMAAVTSICGVGRWLADGFLARRFGTGLFASVPSGAYHCRDGLVYITVNRPLHWQGLARWIHEVTGNEEVLDPMFEGPSSARLPYRELLDLFIGELCERYTAQALYREGQDRHLAITPVASATDLCRDPHLAARRFFTTPEEGDDDALLHPGAPARLSASPWRLRHSAPALGTAELTQRPAPNRVASPPLDDGPAPGALADLRVIELTAGMAGPWIGRFLAACGADVIKIESIRHPDVTRLFVPPDDPEAGVQPQSSPWFTDWNAGKRFVSLDLTCPDGIQLARELIGRADVLVENYSTGVLDKLGLGTSSLREADPRLITFSTTGYGKTGPLRRYITWGPNIEAVSGLATLSGFPERECTFTQFAYPDPLSALHGLYAILCALRHRDETGVGQEIDLAQIESTAASLGPQLLECRARGAEPARRGNRSDGAAPHGVFECAGDDRWVAIAAPDDHAWRRLCNVVGRTEWKTDPRFRDVAARKRNEDELDSEISRWTRSHEPYDAMAMLCGAGVPAGVVQDAEDQYRRDEQLAARGFFETIAHDRKDSVQTTGIPLGLTATPIRTPNAGAAIGRDNRDVLCDLCELSEERYERHRGAGVITDQDDFLALVRG